MERSVLDRLILDRLARNKLSVIAFHKVPLEPDPLVPGELHLAAFDRLLAFIVDRFQVLPLAESLGRLARRGLARPAVCLTFDDGYPDWMTGAVPILDRLGLHATFFITSGQCDGMPMWHERILNALRHANRDEIDLRESGLPPLAIATLDEKRRAAAILEKHFKYQSLGFRDEMIAQLETITGTDPRRIARITRDQVHELGNRGFAIGSHTVNHPILRYCDKESVRFELGAAREILEGITGQRVTGFAYPNGRPSVDFSSLTIRMVREAGYDHALTTDWGVADPGTSPFQIPRFTPWGPGRLRMQIQMARNLLTKPLQIPE